MRNDTDERQRLIDEIGSWPRRIGRPEALKFLRGEYLSHRERIIAQCYICMTGYVDGVRDCDQTLCPLHKLMPYRTKESKQTKTIHQVR